MENKTTTEEKKRPHKKLGEIHPDVVKQLVDSLFSVKEYINESEIIKKPLTKAEIKGLEDIGITYNHKPYHLVHPTIKSKIESVREFNLETQSIVITGYYYVLPIDTENESDLEKLFRDRLANCKSKRLRKKVELFAKAEIKKATNWQQHFPNYEDEGSIDDIYFSKLEDYIDFLKGYNSKQVEPTKDKLPAPESKTKRYTTKHYVLAYLFECNAEGKSYPIGNKIELECIGNERIGVGKGNTFYKVFNKIVSKKLKSNRDLIDIGGEYWRKAVIELTKAPELVEIYLQNNHL